LMFGCYTSFTFLVALWFQLFSISFTYFPFL
jgi:hypothetical protein